MQSCHLSQGYPNPKVHKYGYLDQFYNHTSTFAESPRTVYANIAHQRAIFTTDTAHKCHKILMRLAMKKDISGKFQQRSVIKAVSIPPQFKVSISKLSKFYFGHL